MGNKVDAYTMMKVAEMASEMKACYEDAIRVNGFDPSTNYWTLMMRATMVEHGIPAITSLTKLIPLLSDMDDAAAAQRDYREIMASAYYIAMVEGAPRLTVVRKE